MRFRTILAGALTTVLFAVLSVVAAQPASAANYFPIQNLASGKCVQPHPDNPLGLVQVVQRDCDGSPVQKWLPLPQSTSSTYLFLNQLSGFCMAVHSKTDFAPVEMWSCISSISNTKWRYTPSSVPVLIRSLVGGGTGTRCLEPAGGSYNDMHLWIVPCDANLRTMLWDVH